MRLFIFLSAIVVSVNSFSQITITNADMPVRGDTLRYSGAILDSIGELNFNISGANATWDFSSITPAMQSMANYLPSSQTPYGATFNSPNSFGRKAADNLDLQGNQVSNVFEFFSTTNADFRRDGLGANFLVNIANTFSDPDEVYLFPLDYQDVDSSTFSLTASISIFGTFYSRGYRKNVVDGYGSIITPYGTFNCIRVRTDLVSRDSVSAIGQNVGINSNIREYKWLANGEHLPIMQVNGTVVNNEFVPTTAIYRDNKRNVPENPELEAIFSINTTNPEINKDTVKIISQVIDEGRTAYEYRFTPNTVTFVNNTSSFSPRPEILFDAVGYYTIDFFVTNSNGTSDSTYTDYVYATLNSSVKETSRLEKTMSVFPNPIKAEDGCTVSFELEDHSNIIYELTNLEGKRIRIADGGQMSPGIYQENLPLNLHGLSGIYFLRIHTNEGYSARKLVIQ